MAKYLPKIEPWKHQLEALRRGHAERAFAYLMGTGTGKTKVIIDSAIMHLEDGNIDTLVVFANKGSYRNWASSELPEHVPHRIPYAVYVWDGKKTQQRKLEWEFVTTFKGLRVILVNIEALSTENSRAMDQLWPYMKTHKVMMCVDESTVIKHMTATRTKNAIALGRLAMYRRIMTGTPVTKGPLNLYSQFEFLGPAYLGFKSFFAYRARYSVLKPMTKAFIDKKTGKEKESTFQVPVAWRNIEELSERIAPFSYRVVKEDCLDLPPKQWKKFETFMTDEQTAMYISMRDESIAELDKKEYVIPTDILTVRLRLHQIVCGHIPREDKTIFDLGTNRVESLLEILDELGEKICIWVNYRPSFLKIAAALRKEYGDGSYVEYHGGIDGEQRDRNKMRFINDKPRFFLGNPSIGGKGLTLVVAADAVYFSNKDSLEDREQSEDRIHRPGQHWPCTYTDLICRGTVDESIIKNLRESHEVARLINRDNWREWL